MTSGNFRFSFLNTRVMIRPANRAKATDNRDCIVFQVPFHNFDPQPRAKFYYSTPGARFNLIMLFYSDNMNKKAFDFGQCLRLG